MSSVAEALRPDRSRALSSTTLLAAAYVALSLVGLASLSIGSVPFAVDSPNHAARLFIECNISDPVLSRMYSVEWSLIPNLAIDLINRPLCGVVDPMTVVRGGMVAATAGILLMVWKIHRLLNGQPNAFVLLAPAMTFNIVTGMGYLNYFIGTFLFLAFVWTMLRFRVLDRHPVWSILLPNLFGALLFVCHIFALALAGIFLFGLSFAAEQKRPVTARVLRSGVLTALAFALPLVMMLLAERSGSGITYDLVGKIRALWAPMLYSSVYAAAFTTFLWMALFYWAFRERLAVIAPALRWPLLFLAVFAIALPSALLDAVDLDSRDLVSVAYFAIAGLSLRSPEAKTRDVSVIFFPSIVVIATIAVQVSSMIPKLLLYERQVAEIRQAFDVFSPENKVLTLANIGADFSVPLQMYSHLASYGTRDRKIFNPFDFTGKGMQPLRTAPEFACVDVAAGRPLGVRLAIQLLDPATAPLLRMHRNANYRYAYGWPAKFDYIIYYHFGSDVRLFPKLLTPVREGSFFTIYRTARASRSASPCSKR
jgi:hypothetical protein